MTLAEVENCVLNDQGTKMALKISIVEWFPRELDSILATEFL